VLLSALSLVWQSLNYDKFADMSTSLPPVIGDVACGMSLLSHWDRYRKTVLHPLI
jgi:hypothetical protein